MMAICHVPLFQLNFCVSCVFLTFAGPSIFDRILVMMQSVTFNCTYFLSLSIRSVLSISNYRLLPRPTSSEDLPRAAAATVRKAGRLLLLQFLSNVTIALWNENISLYVFVHVKKRAFHRLGGFSGGVSLDEPLLPASSLTRNTRAAFVCFCQKESGPRVVKSGHGPNSSLARARARPPMRAVPWCRTAPHD